MYIELRIPATLHKKPCSIGLGLCIMLVGNFREFLFHAIG
jgi:hypothetical protein